jgi:hypothetical protein
MYADRDSTGHFSIMDIKEDEADKLSKILREFEFLIQNYKGDISTGDGEKGATVLFSASVGFQTVDAVIKAKKTTIMTAIKDLEKGDPFKTKTGKRTYTVIDTVYSSELNRNIRLLKGGWYVSRQDKEVVKVDPA